jgi:ethylbenzene dioxygenase beta subunit
MTDGARFIYDEAELLDAGDYDNWLDLFSADARYWVPTYPAQTDLLNEVSLFYEDRTLMHARIGRLRHPRALDAPVRTSHVIANVRSMGRSERGDLVVKSRFQMIEFTADEQRLYGGAVTHHLAEQDGGWKIRLKRIDLVNAGGIFDLLQGFF